MGLQIYVCKDNFPMPFTEPIEQPYNVQFSLSDGCVYVYVYINKWYHIQALYLVFTAVCADTKCNQQQWMTSDQINCHCILQISQKALRPFWIYI